MTFSYSLTMMSDWPAALANAYDMLRPGGYIGVVDFYISPNRHNPIARRFWPAWFRRGHVTVSAEHLLRLRKQFEPVSLQECFGRLPFLLWPRVPYYIFVGRKSVN